MQKVANGANRSWIVSRAARGLALLAGIFSPAALFAQACPLCYQSASAASSRFIEALRGGILVLFIPTVLIGACVSVVTYRKRGASDED